MNEKLTAYALNELPPDERAAFEARLKVDPALQKQVEEMKAFCNLLEREIAQDAGTLMPGQRAHLIESFQSAHNVVRPFWRRPAFLSTLGFAAAACLAVILTIHQVKHTENETMVYAPAAPDAGLPQERIATWKEADETFAKKVAVKAAVAEKKEVAKTPRPVASPAPPPPHAIDGLVALAIPPMPTPPGQPESAMAKDQKNVIAATAGAIQIPKGTMDLRKLGDANMNNLSRDLDTDPGGLTRAGAASNNLGAASPSAGTGGARGVILSNSSSQTRGLVTNRGTLEFQAQYAADNSRLKSDAGAPGIDLGGYVATRSNVVSSVSGPIAQTESGVSDPNGSNAFDAAGNGAMNGALAEKSPATSSSLYFGFSTLNLPGISNAGTSGVELPHRGDLPMNEALASTDSGQLRLEEQTISDRVAGGQVPNSSGAGTMVTKSTNVTAGTGSTSSIIKSGAGTLILSGTATFSGGTVINGGSLQVQQNLQEIRPNVGTGASTPMVAGVISGSGTQMSRSAGDKIVGFPAAGATGKKNLGDEAASAPAVPAAPAAAALPETSASENRLMARSDTAKKRGIPPEDRAEIPAERRPTPEGEGRLSKAKEFNSAGYRPVIENPFTFAAQQPLSTMPLDVDTESYANVRRLLNSGQRPPPEAVRIEELINHFPYHYEGPAADRPIAVHVDIADAPWQPLHRIARVAVKSRDVKGERSAATLVTVTKDVNMQIEFNPALVAAYRLIGCETRMAGKEEVNNDRKVAVDFSAGHTVTMLYELVPASLKYPDGKPVANDPKYALAPRSKAAPSPAAPTAPTAPAAPGTPAAKPASAPAAKETMTVKVRYKESNEDPGKRFEVAVTDAHKKLSESDRDFQFAVSVAGFGMLLRGSANSADLSWEGVRKLALAGKGDDEQGRRGEFIQLIEKARSLGEERR